MSLYLEPYNPGFLCCGCWCEFRHEQVIEFLNAEGMVQYLCVNCYSSILKGEMKGFFRSVGVEVKDKFMVVKNGRVVFLDHKSFKKYQRRRK